MDKVNLSDTDARGADEHVELAIPPEGGDMARIHIPEEAPDFNPGYPSKGELIGPVWQAAWTYLRDLDEAAGRRRVTPVSGATIAAHVREQYAAGSEPTVDTVKNLLHAAARAGYLDKGEALIKSRRHTTYKIRRERWR